MLKLVSTSVVRGSERGESHGGVYLIDLEGQEARQIIDWNTTEIDWRGPAGDRGLRGIAIDGETVYIVASDRLIAFTPAFQRVGSWRNRYLKHAAGMCIFERSLYIASSGYDSILAFDLDKQQFYWALHIDVDRFTFTGATYDPMGNDGPLLMNKLHLDAVHANPDGMYISGPKSGGMLHFNGEAINMSATLPDGAHDARPFRDGVLFNDTGADAVRYASRSGEEDRALQVPQYDAADSAESEKVAARQGYARGLCVVNDRIVAAGSSPLTIALHDLETSKTLLSVNLSMDSRATVHGLEVWPF